jgi:type II secretory pathway pseudopilin PulG
MKSGQQNTANERERASEQGFMLLGLIVAVALILLALSVAATSIAFSVHRQREAESVRRANQYVRAIQLYYKKFQTYPSSVEQLENSNQVRYLRQRYVDPLTGKADYRLIAFGQNQTTVKGFFGQPLGGLATSGLGAASGMQSPTTNGATTTPTTPGASNNSAVGTPAASGLPGATGPFVGVGSSATGKSILVVNEQTTYETWEFLYDPRIEALKAAAAMNSGPGSTNANSLGQSPGGGFGQSSGGGFGSPASPPGGTSQSTGGVGQTPSP